MTMLVVNIAEAKAKLSEFLDAVANGERVLICKRNQPIAELTAVTSVRTEARPIGLARQALLVPDSFFEPLPDAVVDDFYGIEGRVRGGKVAEGPQGEPYGARNPAKRGRNQ